jgi:hypothetical protein
MWFASLPDIADRIQRQSDGLIRAWIEAVRDSPRIHSDEDLNENGLRNHAPYLIEEICHLLRAGETPYAANTLEGRVHVYTRYRQGYRARDLVAEFSLLRQLLLDGLAEVLLEERGQVALTTYADAARVINMYLDEALRYAISIYSESTKG